MFGTIKSKFVTVLNRSVPFMRLIQGGFIAILISLPVVACTPKAVEEVERVSSPNGLVDAVSAERLTDATVATPTEVYLVASGQSIGLPVFSADKVEGLRVTWDGDSQLIIRANVARVFIHSPKAVVRLLHGNQAIDVRLDISDRK